MEKKKKLSFVIPCYRSADTLPDVVGRLHSLFGRHPGYDYEIVLVNDCSPDDTFAVIRSLAKANPRVLGLSLSRNFGQHSAILAGLHHVTGDIIILLDDDGQTPPEEAHKLIEAVEAGHDAVVARYAKKKHSFARNLGSRLNSVMAKSLIGKPKDLYLSSFIAIKRFVADEICAYTFPYPYISGMVLRATGDVVNVDVAHKEREQGESGYTMRKLLSLWLNGFTNFSVKPLRVAAVLGAIIAAVGFGVGIYAVVTRFTDPDVPLGWASTTSVTAFIGGIILVVLGLSGEYIGRMYMGLNQQPQYVVREKTDDGEE